MNPYKTKHYKRISNWLLVLAVILFIVGIAILVGPAVIQENELNTAAQEYEQLVDDIMTSSELDDDAISTDGETESNISESESPITPSDSVAVIAPVTPLDEELSMEESVSNFPSSQKENAKPLPENPANTSQNTTTKPAIDVAALKEQNKDFIAWLNIPGTKVDYPVVLSDNTDYYLTHTFSGAKSSLGTLFSLAKTDYANGTAVHWIHRSKRTHRRQGGGRGHSCRLSCPGSHGQEHPQEDLS